MYTVEAIRLLFHAFHRPSCAGHDTKHLLRTPALVTQFLSTITMSKDLEMTDVAKQPEKPEKAENPAELLEQKDETPIVSSIEQLATGKSNAVIPHAPFVLSSPRSYHCCLTSSCRHPSHNQHYRKCRPG